MADYIDRSILCESYIYVPHYNLIAENKISLEASLREYARTRAPLFFGTDLDIETDVVDGSLKIKVTIAVATLFNLFCQYGNIRTSIDYLYKDSQTIASAFVTESMFVAGVKSSELGRTEVRTGIPGALKRVISKIDNLRENSHSMTPEEFSAALAGIRGEILRIIETIPLQQDKALVADGIAQIIAEQFPLDEQGLGSEGDQIPPFIQRREEIDAFLDELRLLSVPRT